MQTLTSSPTQTAHETIPFDGKAGKELENISQEDFVSSCKAWEKWYNLKQRDSQSVLQFTDYLHKVLTLLPRHERGGPSTKERFHRLRSGLRDPIKAELGAQIFQPTTYDDLVKVASGIEEKEMKLLGHATVSRRNPLAPVHPSKGSTQTRSSYRPEPGDNGYRPLHRAKAALDHEDRILGPMPSRVSKPSRRRKHDVGIPRNHGLHLDQKSRGEKSNKICHYICGKSNHTTGEFHEEVPKFSAVLSFPVRLKVPKDT